MKQSEYLYELKVNLETRITPEELNDILSDYESFFVSGREEGKTDDEISKELGSPAFLAKSLLEEHGGIEAKQQDKRISNPGRRICAYLIDAAIAVIPTLLVCIIIGTFTIPYILFFSYPSPVSGVLSAFSVSAYTEGYSTGVVKSVVTVNEKGEQVKKYVNDEIDNKDTVVVNGKKPNQVTSILLIISFIFYLLYSTVCALLFNGQTIGKKLMRIKVRRSNIEKLTRGTVFNREFLGKTLINSIPLIPIISLFMIFFTKEHKALHDMLGDTIVSDV